MDNKKKPYQTPMSQKIELDNQIALVMMSPLTPPGDPPAPIKPKINALDDKPLEWKSPFAE